MSIQTVDSSGRGVHRGLPSYFRASCFIASRGEYGGYFEVGRTLAGSLANEIPYDIEDEDWITEVESLEQLLDADDDEGAWSWFKVHYPRCMALVPARRKERFLAGVRDVYQEEGFGF